MNEYARYLAYFRLPSNQLLLEPLTYGFYFNTLEAIKRFAELNNFCTYTVFQHDGSSLCSYKFLAEFDLENTKCLA